MLRDAAARHPRLKDLAPGLLKRVVFRDAERTASWRQYLCVLVRAVDPRAARHRWVGAKGGHPIVRRACIIGFLPIKNDEPLRGSRRPDVQPTPPTVDAVQLGGSHLTFYGVIILLHFTGPPVPITARVHSTPQRPFTRLFEVLRGIKQSTLGLDTDTIKRTVKTLLSHLLIREFDCPTNSLRTPYCRVSSPRRHFPTRGLQRQVGGPTTETRGYILTTDQSRVEGSGLATFDFGEGVEHLCGRPLEQPPASEREERVPLSGARTTYGPIAWGKGAYSQGGDQWRGGRGNIPGGVRGNGRISTQGKEMRGKVKLHYVRETVTAR
eukprot:1190680-Prorocentrum_minimum.AAC.1